MPAKPTNLPTRVALYARVSTLDKGQDPETQLRPLREYAQRRGFAVVEEYVDQASGTSEERTQYKRMMAAAKKRQLDVVLVWRYDRFCEPWLQHDRGVGTIRWNNDFPVIGADIEKAYAVFSS